MPSFSIHPHQASILYTLRHTSQATFSELMKPTGLLSDAFKFHLRKVQQDGYVVKTAIGGYRLTTVGKEFANNLQQNQRGMLRQPKISLLIFAYRPSATVGEYEYLVQQRSRLPFYDYWGTINGPAQWGEDFKTSALAEFTKQTGLVADLELSGFFRELSRQSPKSDLLEDKLFVVFLAHNAQGTLLNSWRGGHNQWLTEEQYTAKELHFSNGSRCMQLIDSGVTNIGYFTHESHYTIEEY
jgi:hypothetical protein